MPKAMLAKLTRPKLRAVLERERLFGMLDECRDRPAVWVVGPPGAGKTTLVASYIEASKLAGLWYQVDSGDNDVATFFYYLGIAAAQVRPKRRAPLPLLTPEYLPDLSGFTRRYFRELFSLLPSSAVLVLDNYQEIAPGAALHNVIEQALEEIPEGINVIAISRSDPPPEWARVAALERLALVEWPDLRLTFEEAREIATMRHDVDEAALRVLHEQSGGWAAGVTLVLERMKRAGAVADAAQGEGQEAVFNYFAGQIFKTAAPEMREFLIRTALLPWTTEAMAETISGNTNAGKVLDDLYRGHLFTDRRGAKEFTYQYHDLFRAFLLAEAGQIYTTRLLAELRERAGVLLVAHGEADEAFTLYREARAWEAAVRLVLDRAPILMAQGRWQTLKAWISALPKDHVDATPWLLYWLGNALELVNPIDARTALQQAFATFAANADAVGQLLSASVVVETYFFEFGERHMLDPWIGALEKGLAQGPKFPTPAAELRVNSAMLLALTFRRPDHAMIPTCAERVLALLEQDVDVNQKVSSATFLLMYYDLSGRFEAGLALIKAVESFFSAPQVTALSQVSWLTFRGYHFLATASHREAIASLSCAEAIGREHGLAQGEFLAYTFHAFAHIVQGEFCEAEWLLERMAAHLNPARMMRLALYNFGSSMLCQGQGKISLAVHHAKIALDAAQRSGSVFHQILWPSIVSSAYIEASDYATAARLIDDARELQAGTCYHCYDALLLFEQAYAALRQNDLPQAHDRLREALVLARQTNSASFFRWMVKGMPRLFAEALQAGIEFEYVQSLIKRFDVAPETPDVEGWPWPLKICTLGHFTLLHYGQPLEFSRKAPRKPLQLLKAIIALGGREVPERALADALWPGEEGDKAHKVFTMTLARLRKLLGDEDAVRLRGGQVSLNPQQCWVDAVAFERLLKHTKDPAYDEKGVGHALALYEGSFLADDLEAPWALSMRERLRAKFIAHLASLGAQMEAHQRFDDAASLYRRGLEADELSEELYQGLMRCYRYLGRRAQALSVYRRMRQILSVTLSIHPSAESQALFRSLQAETS